MLNIMLDRLDGTPYLKVIFSKSENMAEHGASGSLEHLFPVGFSCVHVWYFVCNQSNNFSANCLAPWWSEFQYRKTTGPLKHHKQSLSLARTEHSIFPLVFLDCLGPTGSFISWKVPEQYSISFFIHPHFLYPVFSLFLFTVLDSLNEEKLFHYRGM